MAAVILQCAVFVAISGIAISGASFTQSNACPASLPVGASCVIVVTYSPASVGTQTGQLTIQSNGSPATTTVSLSGTAVALLPPSLATSEALDFGAQLIGSTTRLGLDLRNTGEQALDITGMALQGAGFRQEGTCASIAPGGLCSVTIVFEPTAVQGYSGTLTIVSNSARGTVSVVLRGQGIAQPTPRIALTPDGVGFANQLFTTASPGQTISVQNVGTAPLHIRGVSVSGAFDLVGNSCPAALAAGARCDVSVAFHPVAVGVFTGRLTVESDAESGRNFTSLSGTGCMFFSVPGARTLQRLCSP